MKTLKRAFRELAPIIILAFSLAICGMQAFGQLSGGLMFPGPGTVHSAGGGSCTPGTNASNYLTRVTAAGGAYSAGDSEAFCIYINGLDTDSLFTKFDALYVYGSDTSAHGLLSLISATYNGTANGSPSFTAYAGFTGVDGSATVYVDTSFPPSSASSPKYTQNSAHMSAWSFTNATSGASGGAIAGLVSGTITQIIPKYADGAARLEINSLGYGATPSTANSTGQWLVNRSSSSRIDAYRNASSVKSDTGSTSATLPAGNIIFLADNAGSPAFGGAYQIAVTSIGSSLSSTDVTNFYNRTCTLLTTLHGSC